MAILSCTEVITSFQVNKVGQQEEDTPMNWCVTLKSNAALILLPIMHVLIIQGWENFWQTVLNLIEWSHHFVVNVIMILDLTNKIKFHNFSNQFAKYNFPVKINSYSTFLFVQDYIHDTVMILWCSHCSLTLCRPVVNSFSVGSVLRGQTRSSLIVISLLPMPTTTMIEECATSRWSAIIKEEVASGRMIWEMWISTQWCKLWIRLWNANYLQIICICLVRAYDYHVVVVVEFWCVCACYKRPCKDVKVASFWVHAIVCTYVYDDDIMCRYIHSYHNVQVYT